PDHLRPVPASDHARASSLLPHAARAEAFAGIACFCGGVPDSETQESAADEVDDGDDDLGFGDYRHLGVAEQDFLAAWGTFNAAPCENSLSLSSPWLSRGVTDMSA